MKTFISLLLIFCMLLPFYGCTENSLSEPVAYSDQLRIGKDCYLDVVEIIPARDTGWLIYLFCQCVLADGSTVWMQMDSEDYVAYFDSSADSYNLDEEAKRIVFDEPVRLNGSVDQTNASLDFYSEESKEVTVFYFESCDKEQTLNKGKRSHAGHLFDEKMRNGVSVYADIVELIPEGTQGGLSVLYQGVLADGSRIWIKIGEEDYIAHFDSNADSYQLDRDLKKITYKGPVRFFGYVDEAEIMLDLYSDERTNVKLLYFTKRDTGASAINPSTSRHCMKFDANMREDVLVYEDIVSFAPKYQVSWTYSVLDTTLAYVGPSITAEGNELWILVSEADYEKYFGSETEFISPARIYGTTSYAKNEGSNVDSFEDIPSLLFSFNGVDPEFEALKVSSLPPAAYTGTERISQRVYVDITRIQVEYTLTSSESFTTLETCICRCTTADGKEVWLHISATELLLSFMMYTSEAEKTLSEPVRINGHICLAELLAEGLAEKIGRTTYVEFDSLPNT